MRKDLCLKYIKGWVGKIRNKFDWSLCYLCNPLVDLQNVAQYLVMASTVLSIQEGKVLSTDNPG